MNKTRRKQLQVLMDSLTKIHEQMQGHLDDEQEYFDNMPEAFQMGERGMDAETAIDALTEAIESLDSVISSLQEVTD